MLISYKSEQVKNQLLLHIVIQKKNETFLNQKNIKLTKRENAFKVFASTYNVEILNFF